MKFCIQEHTSIYIPASQNIETTCVTVGASGKKLHLVVPGAVVVNMKLPELWTTMKTMSSSRHVAFS
jgi:hypothetical protein